MLPVTMRQIIGLSGFRYEGRQMSEWYTSSDEERFNGCEVYPTKAEAIQHAVSELGLEPEEGFFVGKREDVSLEELVRDAAELILERAGERVYDELGYIAEDWPDQKNVESLQAKIEPIILEWFKENSPITFFKVTEIEFVQPEPTSDQAKE